MMLNPPVITKKYYITKKIYAPYLIDLNHKFRAQLNLL